MAEHRQLNEHWAAELYQYNNWQVVELKPADEGYADPYHLAEAIWPLVADWKPPMMVLDMARVTYMSSLLMGNLVQLHKRIAMAGGEMHVARLGAHPTEALHACRLHTVIPLFDSVEAAARVGA